jgi:hypothetical protein
LHQALLVHVLGEAVLLNPMYRRFSAFTPPTHPGPRKWLNSRTT